MTEYPKMFDGIDQGRFANMSQQELRWLDNIKKALNHSDEARQSDHPEDRSLGELFKAIDTAKTLRRSLRGEDTSHRNNRKRFIEFLALEIPACREDAQKFPLYDKVKQQIIEHSLGDVIYAIRCMIHENENLHAAEEVDYYILLDWSHPNPQIPITIQEGTMVCNGYFIWNRLREVIAKFITVIDSLINLANGADSFSFTIDPDLNSIGPDRKERES